MVKISAKKRRKKSSTVKKAKGRNSNSTEMKAKKDAGDASEKGTPTLEVVQEAEKYLELWKKKDEPGSAWRFKVRDFKS